MKGSHEIEIGNNRIRYRFTIRRNITVIRGESATGKTTLIQLLQLYENRGVSSGITLHCDKACTVLSEPRWKQNLQIIHNSIVFIEEGNAFVLSQDFAEAVASSDNYYVLITRESLSNLPYSVTEIYGIRLAGKYGNLKPAYNELYPLYPDTIPSLHADLLIVEDSNAGFQFFSSIKKESVSCISANGKSNIPNLIVSHAKSNMLVIADGAAFGAEMNRIEMLFRNQYQFQLYLPESFEWLILSSTLFNKGEVHRILQNPSDYIESQNYLSWERYFTALLIQESVNTWLQYSKQKLNPAYLQGQTLQDILTSIPDEVRKYMTTIEKGDASDVNN